MNCAYSEQLGVVMQKAYALGNYNGSLFATEGIAAVGLAWAPLSAFVCGAIIGFGNRASFGLPPKFVLLSSAMVVTVLLDVPLSTTLITHGAAVLFMLWCLTPRASFRKK
jgi:hypothetical protein